MRDDALLADIDQDLQLSARARVVYLEGDGDPDVFFALLGVRTPPAVMPGRFAYDGVLVRGLPADRGSGASAVRRRVAVAAERCRAHVYGFIDGDGAPHDILARSFDAPYEGPLFRWKGYAIENVLVRTGWPGQWGRTPVWARVFRRYAPYVALNRLHAQIRDDLAAVGLAVYQQPKIGVQPRKSSEVIRQLEAQAHLLPRRDVVLAYRREVVELLASDPDEQHARLDGKWLVEVLAPEMTGRSKEQCRTEWVLDAAGRGGDQEVRSLWARAIRPAF